MEKTYKRTDDTIDRFDTDPEVSYTIPAQMYFDPKTLEEERRSIFWRSWIYVGHVSELREASQYVTADIAGQRIYVICGKDNILRGFFNVCQHRGHSLLKGKGTAKNVIVCPYHAWSYDADGSLVAAPNSENVAGFDKSDFSLSAIKVEDFCGFIFVNLDPDALPMTEVFPGAEEALRSLVTEPEIFQAAREIPFEIKGNWKNVGDNLLECYHCAPGHRDFVDLVDMSTYEIETHKYWSLQVGGCRPTNTAYNFAPEAPGDETFATLYLWPTLAFAKFPGMPGISTFWFQPTEPEVTQQNFVYYSPTGQLTETDQAGLDYFQNVLGPEDVNLVEDVQRGLHSLSYHQGRFMIDAARTHVSEHAAHHFQNLVMQAQNR